MKSKMVVIYCIILLLVIGNIYQLFEANFSNKLFTDAVPDEKTALQIAESVLMAVYGDDVLSEKPFSVTYNKSKKAWIVIGSLPDGYVGGVAEIIIRKNDGKVLEISHGM